ncbi:phasin family protein [bacterium]|nr:phasin family protein [bacterium]
MGDLVKKLAALGLGALVISEEKVRELTRELIKRGELKKGEAPKFIKEVLKKTSKSRKEIEKGISQAIKKALANLPLVSRDELKKLEKKVEKLEKKVGK